MEVEAVAKATALSSVGALVTDDVDAGSVGRVAVVAARSVRGHVVGSARLCVGACSTKSMPRLRFLAEAVGRVA